MPHGMPEVGFTAATHTQRRACDGGIPAMKRMALRLAGFTFVPMLSMVVPLVILPAVSRTVDAAGWAAINVGLAIGTICSRIIQFGWGIYGPKEVAESTDSSRAQEIYASSMTSRGILSIVFLPAAALGGWLTALESSRWLGAGTALAAALVGLSPTWYFIGTGSAKQLLRVETLPRVILLIAAGAASFITRSPYPYVIGLIFAGLAPIVFAHRVTGIRAQQHYNLRQGYATLKFQWPLAVSTIFGTAYSSTPSVFASAFGDAGGVAGFASVDKLYRMGLAAVASLSNALQGWVFEGGTLDVRRRQRASLSAHAALGLAGLITLGFFGAPLSRFIYGDHLGGSGIEGWAFGASFLAVSLSTPILRVVLVPLGRFKDPMLATLLGATVGILSMSMMGLAWGPPGVALGFALSESATMLTGALLAYRASKTITSRRAQPRQY